MNLKNMSDAMLIKNVVQIALDDRTRLVTLLHYLREIERRRLFSDYKYSSLIDFVVGHLKYSKESAQRRISAMRLMREVPEICDKIKEGSLNLTNICLARALFAKEKKAGRALSTERKRGVVRELENLSTRDAVKVVAKINPDMKKAKELTFDALEDESLRTKLMQLKGLYAHTDPDMSLTELLHKIADVALADANKSPSAPNLDSVAEIYRQNWKRYGGTCTNCGSIHAVEHEHIIPEGAGGETTLENLTLLCKNCNLRSAIKYYGRRKMDDFLNDRIRPYGAARAG